jgi:hypothetical protein
MHTSGSVESISAWSDSGSHGAGPTPFHEACGRAACGVAAAVLRHDVRQVSLNVDMLVKSLT